MTIDTPFNRFIIEYATACSQYIVYVPTTYSNTIDRCSGPKKHYAQQGLQRQDFLWRYHKEKNKPNRF